MTIFEAVVHNSGCKEGNIDSKHPGAEFQKKNKKFRKKFGAYNVIGNSFRGVKHVINNHFPLL